MRVLHKLLTLCISVFISNASAMGIVDFQPTNFSEHATAPFFFSIGKKLKFGDAISEDAPTLFSAGLFDKEFAAVYPSPDQTQAAVVLGDTLYLIQQGKPPTKLLQPVGDNEGSKFSIGDSYYEHYRLQWDAQSRYIFIPRSTKHEPEIDSGFAFSYQRSLVRIDTSNLQVKQEFIPPSHFLFFLNYFLLNENSVCFDSTRKGSVIWKCWIDGNIRSVKYMQNGRMTWSDGTPIEVESLVQDIKNDQFIFDDGTSIDVKPFISYEYARGGEIWLASNGFYLQRISNSLFVDFFHKSKPTLPIFRAEGAIGWLKGGFGEGLKANDSTVLPGGRYALFSFWNGKKLVVDSETGLYKEAPQDSRVYLNFNSQSNPDNFRFFSDWNGAIRLDFLSKRTLRINYNH